LPQQLPIYAALKLTLQAIHWQIRKIASVRRRLALFWSIIVADFIHSTGGHKVFDRLAWYEVLTGFMAERKRIRPA
jgi:hypothetical protein